MEYIGRASYLDSENVWLSTPETGIDAPARGSDFAPVAHLLSFRGYIWKQHVA